MNPSSGPHMSHPFVALALASHHEHIILLIHFSFYHNTRTRTTIGKGRSTPRTPGTSSTSPRSPSRQAANSNDSGVKTCRVSEARAKHSSTYCTTSFASRFPPWSLGVGCGAGVVISKLFCSKGGDGAPHPFLDGVDGPFKRLPGRQSFSSRWSGLEGGCRLDNRNGLRRHQA